MYMCIYLQYRLFDKAFVTHLCFSYYSYCQKMC